MSKIFVLELSKELTQHVHNKLFSTRDVNTDMPIYRKEKWPMPEKIRCYERDSTPRHLDLVSHGSGSYQIPWKHRRMFYDLGKIYINQIFLIMKLGGIFSRDIPYRWETETEICCIYFLMFLEQSIKQLMKTIDDTSFSKIKPTKLWNSTMNLPVSHFIVSPGSDFSSTKKAK